MTSTKTCTTKTRTWATVLLLCAVAWFVHAAGAPLYDGVGFPDEPYRYVQPPPGARPAPPATGTSQATTVTDGANAGLGMQTVEQGPQLTLYLPAGVFTAPAGARKVTVTGTPLAPDGPTPDGVIDGNIYRLTITTETGPVTSTAQAGDATMTLRGTKAWPSVPAGVWRPSPQAPWIRVQTGQAGTDLYTIQFRGAGDYALVQPTPASQTSPTAPGRQPTTAAPGQNTAARTAGSNPGNANTPTASTSSGDNHLGLIALILGTFLLLLAFVAVLSRRLAARPPSRTQTPPEQHQQDWRNQRP